MREGNSVTSLHWRLSSPLVFSLFRMSVWLTRSATAWLLAASLAQAAATPITIAQAHDSVASRNRNAATSTTAQKPRRQREDLNGDIEARLIEVYKLIGQANSREALRKAEALVKDHPNFQLAQLVYGDLLAGKTRPVHALGDVPDTTARAGSLQLAELRQESQLRIKALRERPPPGTIPSQFLSLSSRNRHAIAVDASRSRLYLFENGATGLSLVADYYVSVGKLGIEKSTEGDQRTPLGVYFITSNLSRKSLKGFYGSGALPINYPNQLDVKRGKTGGGIWLHGTPAAQYARAPLSTDGCVAIANPDLSQIIKTVEIRSTPVVIAQSLKWVLPLSLKADTLVFESALENWTKAKSSGDITQITPWYAADFNAFGKTLTDWKPSLIAELKQQAGRGVELKDVSYLRWTDSSDTMVVTFSELVKGARIGRTKRQYWSRQGTRWTIFFEGIV